MMKGYTMQAAYFRGEGRIELVDVPRPTPGPGELLIRVAANGVCGSDLKIYRGGFERIPGHEVAGTVVEAGDGCQTAVGTRVAAYIPLYCGRCPLCARGKENVCQNRPGLLGWATDGGYAEYMLLPDRNALPLADGISFHEGVLLLDTLGTSGHGLRLARCAEVESALVIGAGPIGIGAVALLKAFGVPQVYVSEFSAYRRERAEALGAVAIDPQAVSLEERIYDEHAYGVDLVFEAVGSPATIWQSLDLVAPGGTVSYVGEHWGRLELERPKGRWMLNDITMIRSFYFPRSEFAENQAMILDGRLQASALATHSYPLSQIDQAYEAFISGNTLKVMVNP
jgi:2-desacetyl-2-hydroxyethyl bacteriochlorophyllide A dehydrogenase